ncbi:MAG: site-specific integrase [Firmicutes bacterium]|nr:site-specific integrase [Bacillota bacterium]
MNKTRKPAIIQFQPQTEAESILAGLIGSGIISADDMKNAAIMNKKTMIISVHPYTITKGKGKDTRWATYVEDLDKPNHRRRVVKKTEAELLEYLYELYFGPKAVPGMQTLLDIYPEWFEYKKIKVARLNTLHRYDNDFKRFYLNEPLSRELISTPIYMLKKLQIEKWAYSMIHQHDLTRKAYMNMITPLRQMLDYMIDKDIISVNPVRNVHIDKGHFRPVRKKPAKTQIFFADEKDQLIAAAYQMAEETGDENFLAIPLFFLTGVRIGECLGLSYDDFDEDLHTIRIHRSLIVVDTVDENRNWGKREYRVEEYLKKNAEEREVIATDECFEIVDKVRALQRAKGNYSKMLFNVRTPNNLQRKLAKLCKMTKIEERSPHKIRKTYISTLINQMMDLDFVREQVGHKEIQTTLNSYTYSTARTEKKYADLTNIFDNKSQKKA